jgi:hypothetical protein
MPTTYGYGGFTAEDARQLSGSIVAITTHTDPETKEPGETVGPGEVLYIDGKPYLMLLAPGAGQPGERHVERVVYLLDVAEIHIP